MSNQFDRTLARLVFGLLAIGCVAMHAAEKPAGESDLTPSVGFSVGWEKRPLGRLSNRLAKRTERLCGTAQTLAPDTAGGYAAAYAYYAAAYGKSAGAVVSWFSNGPFGGVTREEAYERYDELRYQHALHDYYAHLYAWDAYVATGSTVWSAASAKAYQAVYYAWADIDN